MCIIVQRHEFNDNKAILREEKAIIQDTKTRVRQKLLDIWRRFTSKSSSRRNHSPPAYVDVVPVPNRQVRPALTRPNSFTADVKYLYTINEVN
ncbi:hypothetical protein V495_00400 [Pseudogymnoascus sp. VKM F-4514 (FW-929)]|nr:hypothetical protein V495_00400 [Pseudogymnoascus sp. VKM F-4514 (FW-929)]